jgi:hypothetical protein
VVLGLVFDGYGAASKLLPGLVVFGAVVLLGALAALVLRRVFDVTPGPAALGGVATAAAVVLTLLLGKPARYQTLYHSPTIVSHTLPSVLAAAAVLAAVLIERRSRVAATVVLGLSAAVLATFNEAFTAVCLVSVAGAALWFAAVGQARRGLRLCGAAGLGLVAGFASVYFSPGSRNRQKLIKQRSVLDSKLFEQTTDNWFDVLSTVLTSSEVLLLLAVAAGVGLAAPAGRYPAATRMLAAAAAVLAIAALASLAATYVLTYSFSGILVGRQRTWPNITAAARCARWLRSPPRRQRHPARGPRAPARAVAARRPSRRAAARRGARLRRRAARLRARRAPGGERRHPGRALARPRRRRSRRRRGRRAAHRRPRRRHGPAGQHLGRAGHPSAGAVAQGARQIAVRPVPIDGLYDPFWPKRHYRWPAECVRSTTASTRSVPRAEHSPRADEEVRAAATEKAVAGHEGSGRWRGGPMKLSVVVPCYDEERNVVPLYTAVAREADVAADEWELVFVDDGSNDGTLAACRALAESDPRVRYVSLSRNFGKESA